METMVPAQSAASTGGEWNLCWQEIEERMRNLRSKEKSAFEAIDSHSRVHDLRKETKDRTLLIKIYLQKYSVSWDDLERVFARFGPIEYTEILSSGGDYHLKIRFQIKESAVKAVESFNHRNIFDGCCRMELFLLSSMESPSPLEQESVDCSPRVDEDPKYTEDSSSAEILSREWSQVNLQDPYKSIEDACHNAMAITGQMGATLREFAEGFRQWQEEREGIPFEDKNREIKSSMKITSQESDVSVVDSVEGSDKPSSDGEFSNDPMIFSPLVGKFLNWDSKFVNWEIELENRGIVLQFSQNFGSKDAHEMFVEMTKQIVVLVTTNEMDWYCSSQGYTSVAEENTIFDPGIASFVIGTGMPKCLLNIGAQRFKLNDESRYHCGSEMKELILLPYDRGNMLLMLKFKEVQIDLWAMAFVFDPGGLWLLLVGRNAISCCHILCWESNIAFN